MDYQFIHSVAKGAYVDLPSAKPVPNTYLTELRKYAGAGDGVNTDMGSCCSYVILKPSNEAAVAFFSRIERKKNARYPCNFIQSAGWTVRDDMLLKEFDAIIEQDFFTEDQVDAFVENSQVPPVADYGRYELLKVNIHRDALKAVLYGCFRRWQMSSAPVRIAVPQNAMSSYNEYVLGAVKEIYSYFPANMRAAVGFCSYMLSQHAANYPGFDIIFMPQTESDSKALLLDGSTISAYEAIPHTTGLKLLDRMIEHILALNDPAERKQFLSSVYQTIEAKTKSNEFNPMAYCSMGEILQMLDVEINVQDLIPLWISFSENKQNYPTDISKELDQHIDKRLTVEQLKNYVERMLPAKPTLEELIDLEKQLLLLSAGREDCQQGLWDDLQNRLHKNAYKPEAVYKMLLAEEKPLAALLGSEKVYQVQEEWSRGLSEELLRREIDEMRRLSHQTSNVKQLDAEYRNRIAAFSKAISSYAYGPVKDEMCSAIQKEADILLQEQVVSTLQKVKDSDLHTQAEIKTALNTIAELGRVLPQSESSASILEELQTLQNDLQEKLDSSRVISRDLTKAVSIEKNYFAALLRAAENISRLSPEDAAMVKEQLRKARPFTRRTYLSEFKKYFGSDFSTAALRGKPAFFKDTALEDLASFYSQPQEITLENKDTTVLLRELHALEHEAELLGAKTSPRVSLSRNCVEDAETIEQVCALRCWSKSLTAQKFTAISNLLLQKGVYRKEQLPALTDMALSLHADVETLVRSVFEGCVPGMDKDDYQRFVDTLREALVQSGTVGSSEAVSWICKAAKTQQLNEEAATVIRDLKRKAKEKAKRKKLRIILASAAAVFILVGAGITFVISRIPHPEPISTEDIIREAFLAGAQSGTFDVSRHNLSSESRSEPSDEAFDDLNYVAQYYKGTVNNPENAEMTSVLPLTPEDLNQLRLGYLGTLDLSGNEDLTSLSALAGLKGIQKLILDDCVGLRPEALRELKAASSLEYLSLRNIPNVTEELAAETAYNNNPSCLVRWTQNGQEMCFLDGNCLLLNSVEWTISNGSNLERLRPVLNDLQGLRSLKLSGTGLAAEDLAFVCELQGLEFLDLSGAELQDEQMTALAEKNDLRIPQRLRMLVLADNPGLSESALGQLKSVLPTECYIDFAADADGGSDAVVLAGERYPSDTAILDLHGRRLSRADLDKISQMNHLVTLNLANTGIKQLPDMSALSGLTFLDASENDLSDADLSTIQYLAGLQELSLKACVLEEIPDLSMLGSLRKVDLSLNRFTFDGLCVGSERGYRFRLPDAPLRTLYLAGCGIDRLPSVLPSQLEDLDLSMNNLSMADMSLFDYGVFLQSLSLSQCELTRIDLHSLSSLQRLNLSRNKLEKLNVYEALPVETLKGLSIAYNEAEMFDLSELPLLKELSWLDLTGIKNAYYTLDDENAEPQTDVIRFVLDRIQTLRVLAVGQDEDIKIEQSDYPECRIVYHTPEDTDR